MRSPSEPTGYDETATTGGGRNDCQITFGFDRVGNHIPKFIVQLHYSSSCLPRTWEVIARFDHNEDDPTGHDIYDGEFHIDVMRKGQSTKTISPPHDPIPQNRGRVIRWCIRYFRSHVNWFVNVYDTDKSPNNPPRWP